MFNWLDFLNERGIPWQENGRRNVDVGCPWCDPGNPHHFILTISLEGKGWHCWKTRNHRGRKATRLVQAMLKCSFEQAKLITGERYKDRENFLDQVNLSLSPAHIASPRSLDLPSDFQEFNPSRLTSARPFVDYLLGRGFKLPTICKLTADYQVYWAKFGQQRYRVIFTVWQSGKLWGWTGRSIVPSAELRYLTTGANDGAEPITNFVMWYDQLIGGGNIIALVEGPFDALKLRTLGLPATCCFTAAPSPAQMQQLHQVLPRYRKRLLILDQGTLATAFDVRRAFPTIPIQVVELPPQYKDPAQLTSLDLLKGFY